MLNKDKPGFDLGKIMDELFGVAEDVAQKVQSEMEKSFPFGKTPWGEGMDYYPTYSFPPMNVYLTQDRTMVIEMALAGFRQQDLELKFQGDYLLFTGTYPEPAPEEGLRYLKRRLKLRSVEQQKYFVPENKFHQGGTQATFKEGLLRIMIPGRMTDQGTGEVKVEIKGAEAAPGPKSDKVKKEG